MNVSNILLHTKDNGTLNFLFVKDGKDIEVALSLVPASTMGLYID